MKRVLASMALTALTLIGCGCGDETPFIDRDLKPMLDLYLMHAPNEGKLDELVAMKFATRFHSDEEKLGECEISRKRMPGTGNVLWVERTIRVIRDAELSWTWKKTVLHELGHCLHNLEHTDNPEDIMYPGQEQTEEWYREHLIERLDAMFDGPTF